MTPQQARARLPVQYAQALLLRDCGVADEVIAKVLDIEHESVGPLLVLGDAKLARLIAGVPDEERTTGDGAWAGNNG